MEPAIVEERAKVAKATLSEPTGTLPQESERDSERQDRDLPGDSMQEAKMKKAVMDLKILNGGKDSSIRQLRQEQDHFFIQLLDASHKMGELETKLLWPLKGSWRAKRF